MDEIQETFKSFEVPDPIRINKVLKFLNKNYPNLSGLSILECGVSKGGLTDRLKDERVECFGVDINPRKIEGVQIKQADLNDGIPDFGRRFEIIFAGEVIEHIFNDRKFLNNCFKNIKPGGYLIITTPNLNFIVNRFLMLFGGLPKFFVEAPYHYHIYNVKKISRMMENAGFNIVKITSSHLLFSTRRSKIGIIFEKLGNLIPTLGAHIIAFAKKPE